MTATFPASAKLRVAGFAQRRQAGLQRSPMEAGPAKQSRYLSRVSVQRPVALLFDTRADYQAFIVWFNTEINRGADWFNWTDPVDGIVKLARIVGGELTDEAPAGSLNAWIVQCTLETWDA